LWDEIIGRIPEDLTQSIPKSRQLYDEETWLGHEIVLDVSSETFLWGYFLLPKDLKKGEKRPVMVALMVSRAFMVESGHDDGVGIHEWVAFK